MNLSIIIVSWNVKEKLRENLKALYKSEGDFDFEVFVVDNNSNDKSAEMIAQEFLQVNLIENKNNLGFAKANNQAIKEACGDFVLLLNPDMRVFPDTLKKSLKWMKENKQANVAGCKLVDEKGKTVPHVRRFPGFWDQLAIVLKIPHIFPNVLDKYLMKDFDYNKASKVDSIRGSFFMIRREALDKVGGLDERFFIWFEEVDFCRQVWENRGEVWYFPEASCLDYFGQSFAQVKRVKTQKYFRDSMLKYFQKWQPAWQYWILRVAWILGFFLVWLGAKVNYKKRVKT